jgi:hypothetical protein
MTEPERRQRRWPAIARKTWWTFWFRPQPAYTLGLVRMAFGALAIGWTMSLLPDLYALFGPHGVVPQQPEYAYLWGAFAIWTSDQALLVGWILLLVSAISLMVGWHSRLAALAAFILIVSFEHRNIWVFNAGDTAIRIEALFLAISPCGVALSLDQRRVTGKFWSAQERPQWPVRLMQVQLSLIYLAAAQAKLNGNAWPQGTAVSYALRLPDMLLLPTPHWFTTSALLMNAVTWGVLTTELAVGILVWNRRLRPWVLAAGVVMHTMVMVTIAVGFFSPAVLVLYLAFVPPAMVERLPRSGNRMARKLIATLPGLRPKFRRRTEDSDSTGDDGGVAELRAESSSAAGTTAED